MTPGNTSSFFTSLLPCWAFLISPSLAFLLSSLTPSLQTSIWNSFPVCSLNGMHSSGTWLGSFTSLLTLHTLSGQSHPCLQLQLPSAVDDSSINSSSLNSPSEFRTFMFSCLQRIFSDSPHRHLKPNKAKIKCHIYPSSASQP